MSFAKVLERLRNPLREHGNCVVNEADLRELLRDWERLDEFRRMYAERALGSTPKPYTETGGEHNQRMYHAPRRNNGILWRAIPRTHEIIVTGSMEGRPIRHATVPRPAWEDPHTRIHALKHAIARIVDSFRIEGF